MEGTARSIIDNIYFPWFTVIVLLGFYFTIPSK